MVSLLRILQSYYDILEAAVECEFSQLILRIEEVINTTSSNIGSELARLD